MVRTQENLGSTIAQLAACFAFCLLAVMAQAQTPQVLHNFIGKDDGAGPYGGLTLDASGNLYGTASVGGAGHDGVVFRMSHVGSGWIFSPLYSFGGKSDGARPYSGVIFGPDGALYGMTFEGGQNDAGTVYRLSPSPTLCTSFICTWEETLLYSFCPQRPCTDGAGPNLSNVVFDKAGNIYGATGSGGIDNSGVIFKLTASNGSWTESVIYSFPSSCDNGCGPEGNLIFDSAGNLYGTTCCGGQYGSGTAFELSPSGSGWTEQTLASINLLPYDVTLGGLAMDGHGNLFGTSGGGEQGGVFELTSSNGSWTFNVLTNLPDNVGPYDAPTLDAAGNVYGTACGEGQGDGEVFKLVPSKGGWIYTSIPFDYSNGECPVGGVVFDSAGNMYGTTLLGGSGDCGDGCGVVWEITP